MEKDDTAFHVTTSEAAKLRRREYAREWRAAHPGKNKQYIATYWEKRAARANEDRMTERIAGITGLKACYYECDHPDSGCGCVRIREALQKLFRYEDTGLTPGQCAELKRELNAAVADIPHDCSTCIYKPENNSSANEYGMRRCKRGCSVNALEIQDAAKCSWEWRGSTAFQKEAQP